MRGTGPPHVVRAASAEAARTWRPRPPGHNHLGETLRSGNTKDFVVKYHLYHRRENRSFDIFFLSGAITSVFYKLPQLDKFGNKCFTVLK